MSGEEILKIEKCGDLFPYGLDNIKNRYKELVKQWHPDINKKDNASDVFTKITYLYNRALDLFECGTWEKTNYVLLPKENGKKIALNFDTMFDFELGTCYVSKTKVVYVLGSEKEKYYLNTLKMFKSLRYKDKKMESDLGKFFPDLYDSSKLSDGRYCIVLSKTEDVVPLQNVFDYFHGKIEDRHVAWIISRLCNLSCFLKFNGVVHNGINLCNCFVSPQYHSILLLGGWWYANKENEKMLGTTKDIFSIMSVSSKGSKVSNCLTDLESIKLLGRQLLGEPNCRKLALNKEVPKSFINFLVGGSGNNAYEEFSKWDKALNDSYGKREFIKMNIKNLYERKGD